MLRIWLPNDDNMNFQVISICFYYVHLKMLAAKLDVVKSRAAGNSLSSSNNNSGRSARKAGSGPMGTTSSSATDKYFDDFNNIVSTANMSASGASTSTSSRRGRGNYYTMVTSAEGGSGGGGSGGDVSYRANVQYLYPEQVGVEVYRQCFKDGQFRTSVCPLPACDVDPSNSAASPSANEPNGACADAGSGSAQPLINVAPAVQATFRPKALLRSKALSYFLHCSRPLHLGHYSATKPIGGSKQATVLHTTSSSSSTTTSAAGGAQYQQDNESAQSAASHGAESFSGAVISGGMPKKTVADMMAIKPEKRKYVFKNKPNKLAVPPATASQISALEGSSGNVSGIGGAAAASVGVTAGSMEEEFDASTIPSLEANVQLKQEKTQQLHRDQPANNQTATTSSQPISAANIHIPANLTLSASCFMLDTGCSRYALGDGSVYTRVVNADAKVFHLESKR